MGKEGKDRCMTRDKGRGEGRDEERDEKERVRKGPYRSFIILQPSLSSSLLSSTAQSTTDVPPPPSPLLHHPIHHRHPSPFPLLHHTIHHSHPSPFPLLSFPLTLLHHPLHQLLFQTPSSSHSQPRASSCYRRRIVPQVVYCMRVPAVRRPGNQFVPTSFTLRRLLKAEAVVAAVGQAGVCCNVFPLAWSTLFCLPLFYLTLVYTVSSRLENL
ncbi:hypothetical protein Pcinc_043413 [Petrolisthes cinctipes]|uniref:Uncharacterized protein n=1 Tax=Petrolisthes cinctipes TaxID=88211 RepID=A0AAE1BGK2_PETCI|nr:hypothetical protein Pcinc_043413 [Petrolisthes cinctipes]